MSYRKAIYTLQFIQNLAFILQPSISKATQRALAAQLGFSAVTARSTTTFVTAFYTRFFSSMKWGKKTAHRDTSLLAHIHTPIQPHISLLAFNRTKSVDLYMRSTQPPRTRWHLQTPHRHREWEKQSQRRRRRQQFFSWRKISLLQKTRQRPRA